MDSSKHNLNKHMLIEMDLGIFLRLTYAKSCVIYSTSQEWKEYLQSAGDDGVVIFSMGSYAAGIDENIASMFAGAFAQIPQKVIWKLNGKPSTSLPSNVKVVDWIPQNDLLG